MPDVAAWLAALPTLAGFGLMLGLNPLLYGATADALARNSRVAARVGAMVLGLVTGATVLYVLLQSFDPTAFVDVVEQDAGDVARSRRVDVVAGMIFLAAATGIALWKIRSPATPARRPRSDVSGTGSWRYFALGVSCSVIGFTTLPIMYMTGRVTAGISPEIVPRLLAYGVFLVALVAPFVILAGAWTRFPVAAQRVTRSYARIAAMDHRWIYVAVLALTGLFCLGVGLFAPR